MLYKQLDHPISGQIRVSPDLPPPDLPPRSFRKWLTSTGMITLERFPEQEHHVLAPFLHHSEPRRHGQALCRRC